MADQIVTSEVPATTNQWFACFRLAETLLAAGWTVVESSEGLAFAGTFTSDNWTGNFGSLVANAWMVIQANSGQQIVFRRGGTSITDGWVVWLPGGGYTAANNQTDELPGDLPGTIEVDSCQIRGTITVPQTYTTDGPWFGNTSAIDRLYIGCRDATGSGDESFWIVTKRTGASLGSGAHGDLIFDAVVHTAGLGIADTLPYVWHCPSSLTSTWGAAFDTLNRYLTEDNVGGTIGRWRRMWNAGQGSAVFKQYASGTVYPGWTSTPAEWGHNPGHFTVDDQAVHQATITNVARSFNIIKTLETGFKDFDGGWTQNVFYNSIDVANLDTINSGAYAKLGDFLIVWWDGNAGNPPAE